MNTLTSRICFSGMHNLGLASLLVVAASLLLLAAPALANEPPLPRVSLGAAINAGKLFYNLLNVNMNDKPMDQVITYIKNFLPIGKMIVDFIKGSESVSLNQIYSMLESIQKDIKAIGEQLKGIEKQIDWTSTFNTYRKEKDEIQNAKDLYNLYARRKITQSTWMDRFKQKLKAGGVLFRGLMEDRIGGKSITSMVAERLGYHRTRVSAFMQDKLELLVMAAQMEISYTQIQSPGSVGGITQLWEGRIRQFTARMKEVDNEVKRNWKSTSNTVIRKWIGELSNQNNKMLARLLESRLKEYFDWRKFIVVVYPSGIHGGVGRLHASYMRAHDGQEFNGVDSRRNVMVGTTDTTSRSWSGWSKSKAEEVFRAIDGWDNKSARDWNDKIQSLLPADGIRATFIATVSFPWVGGDVEYEGLPTRVVHKLFSCFPEGRWCMSEKRRMWVYIFG